VQSWVTRRLRVQRGFSAGPGGALLAARQFAARCRVRPPAPCRLRPRRLPRSCSGSTQPGDFTPRDARAVSCRRRAPGPEVVTRCQPRRCVWRDHALGLFLGRLLPGVWSCPSRSETALRGEPDLPWGALGRGRGSETK